MRRSLLSVTFAAALFLNCNAIPMGKTEDGSLEQEVFASILNDEAMEGDADLASATRARASKVIVIAADPMIWRDLKVLQNGMSVYKRRADDSNQVGEHGDGGQQQSIPILRRDNMRCMVGRVYRPCWEV
ncbi:pro-melanin-concentrating hormone, like [Gambusia affinis]|uniref:pro-melanin-concentrating hormone, like n=1 Tax=Gambusia affinis TaxID=33528 RepID=UPI000F3781ED|nr:pro-melanin-concentrating hormone, like [Gambusia affinis]